VLENNINHILGSQLKLLGWYGYLTKVGLFSHQNIVNWWCKTPDNIIDINKSQDFKKMMESDKLNYKNDDIFENLN
jgi:hypothetical protein